MAARLKEILRGEASGIGPSGGHRNPQERVGYA